MLREFLSRVSLFELLYRVDCDLAERHRARGCPHCGGPLHRASYARKPRGALVGLAEPYSVRQSLCCGRQGCRLRSAPPSVLFLGRRVYWSVVVLLVVALRQQRPCSTSVGSVCRLLGVWRHTVARWMRWYREVFAVSAAGRLLRGRLGLRGQPESLLADLLGVLNVGPEGEDASLVAALRWLGHPPTGPPPGRAR